MNRFRYVLEKELFRLYFTSLKDIDRDIRTVSLFSPSSVNNISSIKYIIQFINYGRVVQEVSIMFRFNRNRTQLKIQKHMKSDQLKGYDTSKEFIFNNRTGIEVEFVRIDDKNFIIKIDKVIEDVLSAKCRENSCVYIESIVKCFITIKDRSKIKLPIDIEIIKPKLNSNISAELTHQHRICLNKDKKKDFYIDVGIIKIDKHIHSVGTKQKILADVNNNGNICRIHNANYVY